MANNNQGVFVRKNTDDRLVQQYFGDRLNDIANRGNSANVPNLAQYADEDLNTYIPNAGISTRRGSRSVRNSDKNPFAEPNGSPADIVHREIVSHPELRDPRNARPVAAPRNIVNRIDGGNLLQPMEKMPPQSEFIPEEYKDMMPYNHAPRVAPPPHQDPTVIQQPRQYPTEDMPGNNTYHSHPAPPPPPPGPKPGAFIPPSTAPIQPSEDMIVKVLGYNESNVKLLGLVSENVSRCSAILAEINNTAVPLDAQRMLEVLQFMDNSTFRKVLADAFTETLQKNMALSTTISSYLSGTAVIDDTPSQPSDPSSPSDGGSTGGDTTPGDSGQNTSDPSLPPEGKDDDTKSSGDEPTVTPDPTPSPDPTPTPGDDGGDTTPGDSSATTELSDPTIPSGGDESSETGSDDTTSTTGDESGTESGSETTPSDETTPSGGDDTTPSDIEDGSDTTPSTGEDETGSEGTP